jgi:hypothetical protein
MNIDQKRGGEESKEPMNITIDQKRGGEESNERESMSMNIKQKLGQEPMNGRKSMSDVKSMQLSDFKSMQPLQIPPNSLQFSWPNMEEDEDLENGQHQIGWNKFRRAKIALARDIRTKNFFFIDSVTRKPINLGVGPGSQKLGVDDSEIYSKLGQIAKQAVIQREIVEKAQESNGNKKQVGQGSNLYGFRDGFSSEEDGSESDVNDQEDSNMKSDEKSLTNEKKLNVSKKSKKRGKKVLLSKGLQKYVDKNTQGNPLDVDMVLQGLSTEMSLHEEQQKQQKLLELQKKQQKKQKLLEIQTDKGNPRYLEIQKKFQRVLEEDKVLRRESRLFLNELFEQVQAEQEKLDFLKSFHRQCTEMKGR